jgi:hypothetical protein
MILEKADFTKPKRGIKRVFLHCSASDNPKHDNVKTEIWKKILGYEEYSVSNTGKVRRDVAKRRCRAKILKASIDVRGYACVNLHNGKQKKFYIHHLVATAFLGTKPSAEHQIAHFDGNPSNAHVSNLRYVTQAENEADKKRHGRFGNHGRRLSPTTRALIIKLRAEGLPFAMIYRLTGVSMGSVQRIAKELEVA